MNIGRVRRWTTHPKQKLLESYEEKTYLISTPEEWRKFAQKFLPVFSPKDLTKE